MGSIGLYKEAVDLLMSINRSNLKVYGELAFDAFLQLFPDFVDKVNELLNEKDRFVLKRGGELLNPELRIIALIHLGISDGTKISLFFRYSLTTVYNYRTKTKNRTSEYR